MVQSVRAMWQCQPGFRQGPVPVGASFWVLCCSSSVGHGGDLPALSDDDRRGDKFVNGGGTMT